MGSVKWTEDQQKAIDLRYKNILVSAAAGSGKTAVLVERIINIITDLDNPVDIDKLLIVTFTNAAAAEMRERIGEAINKKIKEEPNSRNLQKQLILLNKASISTLHSFCLNLIKSNFYELDIEPNFRVGDSTEINLLKIEALEELMESKYASGSEEFLNLVESYCDNKSDKALADIILRLYNFSMSMANPEKWLIQKAESFNVEDNFSFDTLPFKDALLKELEEEILTALEVNNRGMDFILEREFLSKYVPTFEGDGEILEKTLEIVSSGLKEDMEYLNEVSFSRIPTISKLNEDEKAIQAEAKAFRDEVKEMWSDAKGKILNATSEDMAKSTIKLYPLIKELSSLVIEFKNNFDKKKRERNIVDFNDQEHFALQILKDSEDEIKPSNIALEMMERYEEILVDEYQDSNNVQEEIISLICRKESGKRNIFMVGDLKQSIYRFRMAKPELFKDKKNTYTKNGDEFNALITLHKNFRSRKEVIDGINYIFRGVMSEEVGDLTYDEDEELKVGALYKEAKTLDSVGGPVEFDLLDLQSKEEDTEEVSVDEEKSGEDELTTEELDAIQIEARFVANRILKLMETQGKESLQVYDKHLDEYRMATYKDIVILLRSSNKLSPIFVEEFKKAGIPIFSESGRGYFDTLEVKTILSVLEIIDNPLQDIPLIAALRSPIFGFTTENLADIRLVKKKCNFYNAMKKVVKVDSSCEDVIISEILRDDKLKEKINNFLEKLEKWRTESRYTPINKLIWDIITDTGYYGYVGALPGGQQRQANLKILFKRAKDFEKTSYRGLYSFINFINNIKVSSEDMGSAKIIGENENVVRIMSIHKSKGLEFPVVFLCGLGKRFNEGDLKGKILFHEELGYGPIYIDLDNRISHNTIQREFIGKRIKAENISEEMRLLYVALTRAKEKLILVGSSKKVDKLLKKWAGANLTEEGNIVGSYVKNQNNYMDWIGPTIINHRDGESLRHYSENELKDNLNEDESKFVVNILPASCFQEEVEEENNEVLTEEKLNKLLSNDVEENIYNDINLRLSYKYDYEEATKLQTVITVTEIKEIHNSEIQEPLDREEEVYEFKNVARTLIQTPLFLQEKKGLTPSEVGTAYHNVMEKLKLQENITKEEIQKQINNMISREFLTIEEGKAVDINKIYKFFSSDIGKSIIEAENENRLSRELPFRIEMESTKIYDDLDNDRYAEDKMLLRGVIDCYIDDGEDAIIIDYKTDYVTEKNIEEIKERYKIQLDYYSKAIKDVLKKRNVKKYLYLFSIGEFVLLSDS